MNILLPQIRSHSPWKTMFTLLLILFGFLIGIAFFSGSESFLFAQGEGSDAAGTDPVADEATVAVSECPDYVETFIRNKTIEFSDYMTNHFQSGDDASVLLPKAIQRFRLYYFDLVHELDTIPISEKEGEARTVLQSPRDACQKRVTDTVFAAKEIIKMHVLTNAQGKKATKLINKYKEINDKLDKLNFNVAQMYGYILTFTNKLPCYVDRCN